MTTAAIQDDGTRLSKRKKGEEEGNIHFKILTREYNSLCVHGLGISIMTMHNP